VDFTATSTVLAFVAATLVGALPPVIRRWSEKGLHLFIAVSAGVLLGTVFLELLPALGSAAALEIEGEHAGHGHAAHASTLPWLATLAGFLGLFLLEKVWLRGNEERERVDPHTVIWLSTYIGISFHAFVAGLGFAALELKALVLVPLLWHKLTESFSLTAVLSLAGVRRGVSWGLIGLFSLVTPVGFLLGREVLSSEVGGAALLTGLACGTFLYVAACDLLPEVFHHQGDHRTGRIVALLAGIAAVGVVPHGGHVEESFLYLTLAASWRVFVAMAPYLLLGFLVAGALSQWLEPRWLTRLLAGERAKSVGIASVIGAPLPLCSCSVLPVAASLRRAGAGKGATSAFLVSTPETGVDSVSVTWGLLDPLLTIARPLGAILSALLVGLGVSRFARSGRDDEPRAGLEAEAGAPCCECSPEGGGCTEAVSAEPASPPPPRGVGVRSLRALRYAFVEMFDDLAGALLVGVLLSGVIAAVLPEDLFDGPLLAGGGGILAMLVIGIPIYVCASASTPIAAALVLKGLSPGAALVFLLAGPATNLTTLAVMTRTLGKRATLVHLAILAAVTLALGFGVNALYAALELEPFARAGAEHGEVEGWIANACAAALALLIVATGYRALVRRMTRGRSSA